ncbi:MAG: VOC family protein [Microcoleaceae cyanobacterium]
MLEEHFELDHLFIWVASDAPEKTTLIESGFQFDEELIVHHGQGTASITFSFENAYIELIWVNDEDEAAKFGQAINTDLLARARWHSTGACPFGIALRRKDKVRAALPFAVRPFHAEWMRANDTILFAEGASDLGTPLIFVIPPEMDWAAAVEGDANLRDSICHPIGSRQLTLTQATITSTIFDIGALGALTNALQFEVGSAPLVSLTLDDGRQRQAMSFEPALPLKIQL